MIRPLLMLCALALVLPAAAAAQQPVPTKIDGSPLNIFVSPDGSLQVNVDGAQGSEFYPPFGFDPVSGQSIPSQNANAGFGLILDPTGAGRGTRSFGRFVAGSMPTPDSGPTQTDPDTVVTTWTLADATASPALRVVQTIHYQEGSRQVEASFAITNVNGAAQTYRANVGGDLAIRGTDAGVGFLLGNPPTRFMGGLNQDVGAAGGFAEETPWSAFETGPLGTVSSHASDASGPGFDNSVSPDNVDNAAGVQWDDHYSNGLASGATAVYNVALRFVDTLGLTPVTAQEEIGAQHVVTATSGSLDGSVAAGQKLVYEVTGSNPTSGTVTTGADGKADIAWVGGQVGTDTLTVFQDQNGNGVRDASEPQATATVEWQGTVPAPTLGQSADVKPVSGKVKIKLPKGTSPITAKRLGFHGAASQFQPLTGAAQVPIGSTLDTTKGTVQLLTAGSKASATTGLSTYQSGQFKNGLFTVAQTRKNPLVQLSMGGNALRGCKTGLSRGGAARTRSRRLFGNAHGHFRTRGRNSSATVRGTMWSMTDTCAGTLTAVSRGSVVVRDFRLRKNKTVKAGHHYFAKAPKKKSKKG
jgi:hypothetical protein